MSKSDLKDTGLQERNELRARNGDGCVVWGEGMGSA